MLEKSGYVGEVCVSMLEKSVSYVGEVCGFRIPGTAMMASDLVQRLEVASPMT